MNPKQRVAEYAAQHIESGMIVGLGTGSTANFFIDALARRSQQDNLKVECVASSTISAIHARQQGLPLLAIEQIGKLDVYVDGADEVTPDRVLLKGRGQDLVREKLLAGASDKFWVLIDASKMVERLGQNFPIPIEVLPCGWQMVERRLQAIAGKPQLRRNGDNLFFSAHGSLVLDTIFASMDDIETLDNQLNAIPGIVEHGIFAGLASAVLCADGERILIDGAL